jgi:phosphoserine phosphatase
MRVILLRHGEILSNLKGFYSGRSDEALTPRGIEQAHAAGAKLAGTAVEAMYSSPLRRTMETANIVASYLHCSVSPEDALNEMIMGPWEKRTEKDIASISPDDWTLWNTRPADLVLPGRESLADIAVRVNALLKRLMRQHSGTVVLVTHYAVIRIALLSLRGEDLNLYKSIKVPNSEPMFLNIEEAMLNG